MQARSYTLSQLAEYSGARREGATDPEIRGLGSLDRARVGQLTFLGDSRRRHLLAKTRASAIVLRAADGAACRLPALVCDDPYLTFADISRLFRRDHAQSPGIHPSAVVAADVVLGEGVAIAAGSVVAAGCVLGDGAVVGPNCTLMENCHVGPACRLVARVTLQCDVRLGRAVVIHPGAVIGADGFGYANRAGRWVKIEQLGGVEIGDDVEIGANTTIDCGALDATVIGDGVKIDNLVQIGHNVRIGADTAIAGCVGIAGSAVIGKRCMIGGHSGIQGHVEIGDDVVISGMTAVTKSIPAAGRYTSCIPHQPHREWLRGAAWFRRLDELARRVGALERRDAGAEGERR